MASILKFFGTKLSIIKFYYKSYIYSLGNFINYIIKYKYEEKN